LEKKRGKDSLLFPSFDKRTTRRKTLTPFPSSWAGESGDFSLHLLRVIGKKTTSSPTTSREEGGRREEA